MTPELLEALLGPAYNVPRDRILAICDALTQEIDRAVTRAMRQHELQYHHGYLTLDISDRDNWMRKLVN